MTSTESRRVNGEVDERRHDSTTVSRHEDESHCEDALVGRTEVITAPGDCVGNRWADGADAENESEIGDSRLSNGVDDAENDEPDTAQRHPQNVQLPSIAGAIRVQGGENSNEEGEEEGWC